MSDTSSIHERPQMLTPNVHALHLSGALAPAARARLEATMPADMLIDPAWLDRFNEARAYEAETCLEYGGLRAA